MPREIVKKKKETMPNGHKCCQKCKEAPRRCGEAPKACDKVPELTLPPRPDCSQATPADKTQCVQFCDVLLMNELLAYQNAQQQRLILEIATNIARLATCYLCPSCRQSAAQELSSLLGSGSGYQAPATGNELVVEAHDTLLEALCSGNAAAYMAAVTALGNSNQNFVVVLMNLNTLLGQLLARLVECCSGN